MKIDTSSINMSSQAYYRETVTSGRTTTIAYWDLANGGKENSSQETVQEQEQFENEWKNKSISRLDNTDSLAHPLAFARNYAKASNMRNTAYEQLRVLEGNLTDEQRDQLSETAKKGLELMNLTRAFQMKKTAGNQFEFKPLEPENPPVFEPTGSVVTDIDTMVAWIQDSVERRNLYLRSPNRQGAEQIENLAVSDYMKRTAIDNIVSMGKDLSQEQFGRLSEQSKELVQYYMATRSDPNDVSRLQEGDILEFKSSGSVVDDIETMAAWLDESFRINRELPHPKLLGLWGPQENTYHLYGGFDPLDVSAHL